MSVELAARTVRGLEWVAADEVAVAAGGVAPTLGHRQVTWSADGLDPALLGLRTVDDLWVRVGTVDRVGRGPATLGPAAGRIAALDVAGAARLVGEVRRIPRRPVVDVVANLSGDRRFSRYDLEDAVGEVLGTALGGRHASRRHGRPPPADLSVRVDVRGDQAEVSVRVGDRPLHRRPWKVATGPATLHPPMAAALVRLAGAGPVLDPCCGDGTIPIEAVLAGVPAVGSDLDRTRLVHAAANAGAAGAPVPLAVADAARLPARTGDGAVMVTNPPWDLLVAPGGGLGRGGAGGGLDALWDEAARLAPDCLVALTEGSLGAPAAMAHAGWEVVVADRVRLAGRLADVVVAHLPGTADPLGPSLRRWRERV